MRLVCFLLFGREDRDGVRGWADGMEVLLGFEFEYEVYRFLARGGVRSVLGVGEEVGDGV